MNEITYVKAHCTAPGKEQAVRRCFCSDSVFHAFISPVLTSPSCLLFLPCSRFQLACLPSYSWECISPANNSMPISESMVQQYHCLCSLLLLVQPLTHAHAILVLSYNSISYLALREVRQNSLTGDNSRIIRHP